MNAQDPTKGPAAVVLLTRGSLVLGLTRRARIFDLHLPGGKWEPCDGEAGNVQEGGVLALGPNLRKAATRELAEETGICLWTDLLEPLCSFVAHTGRPVLAYRVDDGGLDWPETFRITDAGWPGWVPPASLVAPWCTFREECAQILAAAGIPT